jgi:NADPH:quinone reductase
MRAMVLEEYGGPEKYQLRDIPIPNPGEGEVRIKVRAFGVNRAEEHMRRGHWGEVVRVSGIECVGEVDSDPSGALRKGQTVAAVVGDLGRTRNGSYAEFTCPLLTNVFPLETSLTWEKLATIPESYSTAWVALFDNLKLRKGQILLIRGAASALGQAAINIAANHGASVLATTRSERKMAHLKSLGANTVLMENAQLSSAIRGIHPQGIDGVLDIVGNSVLRDSLRALKKGGCLCLVGFLGGGDPVESFNPLLDLPSGVDLNFFASGLVLGNTDYPLSGIPMQSIIENVEKGVYKAEPAKVFPFEQLAEAHRLMESNEANGKIVVVM